MINHLAQGIVGGAVFAAGLVIDQSTLLPIGSAMAVMTGVWWMGRKLQKLEDNQEELYRWIRHLPCQESGKCKDKEK